LRSGGCGSALNFARQLPKALSGMPSASQILPLIHVAALPRLVVRPPESFTLTQPPPVLVRHRVLLNLQIERENRSRPWAINQVCEKSTLTSQITCSFPDF
jgi:hypothetical protein